MNAPHPDNALLALYVREQRRLRERIAELEAEVGRLEEKLADTQHAGAVLADGWTVKLLRETM